MLDRRDYATGSKQRPSLSFYDAGEGQLAEDFPKTFCSLIYGTEDGSYKGAIPFVQGRFNMGGTGVLPFCSDGHKLQLIVSRVPNDVAKGDDHEWGFTIFCLFPTKQDPSWRYLVGPDGKILTAGSKALALVPKIGAKSGEVCAPREREVASGTLIKMYDYKAPRSNICGELFKKLEDYLLRPALPLRLIECRPEYKANVMGVTIWDRLSAWGKGKLEDGFEDGASIQIKLSTGETIPGEVRVFKAVKGKDIEDDQPQTGLRALINGQSHAKRDSQFFRTKAVDKEHIAGSMLVTLDCTDLGQASRNALFMSNRETFRDDPLLQELLKKLQKELHDHEGLVQLNLKRYEEKIANAVDDEDGINALEELLSTDPSLADLFGSVVAGKVAAKTATNGKGGKIDGEPQPFQGNEFPTFFRRKDGSTSVEVDLPRGETTRASFQTDVRNNYFSRKKHRGTCEFKDGFQPTFHLFNGRLTFTCHVDKDVSEGTILKTDAVITDNKGSGPFTLSIIGHVVAPHEKEPSEHTPKPKPDPRTLPPVMIKLTLEEPQAGAWDADMVAALDDITTVTQDGRNVVTLRVICSWNDEAEVFDPVWEFLDGAGQPLSERRRSNNLISFFGYLPVFWLGALRDAANEFTPRSGHWGRLLKSVRIPDELENEALRILSELDERIVAADPRLNDIATQIGEATRIAVGEGPGAVRVNTLPMAIEDMLQRTGVVMRNEELRPWLPLSHHGQGLQSLAVIFLFQAAVLQQLAESDRSGVDAVFEIEEPEAHLHPQAARTLWDRISALAGQRLITTHSPYFVQNVPLHDLRIVRLCGGQTKVAALPRFFASELPWNDSVAGFARGVASATFFKDTAGKVAAKSWFNQATAENLSRCYRRDADAGAAAAAVERLRHECRILPTAEDESDLGFHCRRVRGEIFFARQWVLVEGVTEYLLVHALGKALGWPLDAHGVAVVDFQQSGGAGIYPALAEAFGIPWHMIVDGDAESEKFKNQILDRGFREDELTGRFISLPAPNELEDQLIADGHLQLLRGILAEIGSDSALRCPEDELRARLKNRKTGYMGVLSLRVASDRALAERMPEAFVNLITSLRDAQV